MVCLLLSIYICGRRVQLQANPVARGPIVGTGINKAIAAPTPASIHLQICYGASRYLQRCFKHGARNFTTAGAATRTVTREALVEQQAAIARKLDLSV